MKSIPLPIETERLLLRAWRPRERGRACVDAALAHLAVGRIVAKVDVDNERSLHLLRRLGMTPVETIEVEGRPHVLLALERSGG